MNLVVICLIGYITFKAKLGVTAAFEKICQHRKLGSETVTSILSPKIVKKTLL